MNLRIHTAAPTFPRLLAVLALAITLVAIPAFQTMPAPGV
jgi:hypothetical protein